MRRASILHSFNSSPEGQSDTCSTRTLLQNSIQYELLALLSHTTSLREVIKSTSSRTYCSVPHRIVQLRRDGPTHRLPYGLEGLPNSAEQRTHDVGLVLLFGMVGPIARRVIDAMPSLSPYHAKGRARRCIARQLASWCFGAQAQLGRPPERPVPRHLLRRTGVADIAHCQVDACSTAC